MNINFSPMNFNLCKGNFVKSKVNSSIGFRGEQKNDTFEMSVGYVNDIHGQANNMMRILSGIKGDLRLSAGDNDIGAEGNKEIHGATAKFLTLANIKASALGNHEFDNSQKGFIEMAKSIGTKFLSLNLNEEVVEDKTKEGIPEYHKVEVGDVLQNSMIVEVKGEKIGLVGASPMDMFERTMTGQHDDCKIDDLDTTIDKIQAEVRKLQEQGINKIFLLSHLGHKRDQRVAQETEGIDVIIGGHTHELVQGITEGENLFYTKTGEPVVITEAGKDGSYFGLLNLTFDKEGVLKKAQNNIGETRLFSKNMINQYLFDEIMGKPDDVGFIKKAPPPPKNLIEENPHANFVCDAMKSATNSDIAIWNNSGIRNFFHEGSIDSRDIKDIAPFLDRICVANVSEKAIVDDIKRSIKTTYESSGHKPGLIAVSGLNYTVNETTHELVNMNFIDKEGNAIPIDIDNPRADKTYRLVTDEYMMAAGADYDKLADYDQCLEIYPYDKDVITCQYIKELNKPIIIDQTGRINYIK